ncbi:MAG TPA: DUF4388 domain-containing protein [Thermoanaerobaculia bacterium]|nr:DUF4388 domain-containing protein [Thermoanaerobaculia bacterium]
MDPRFEFRGDLAATPLPEVLLTVHHYKVPGVVSAVKEGVEKKIFIWDGDVIFASSGDRRDSLGDVLLASGRITQEQFDKSVEILLFSSGGKRHGEILVDMGAVKPDELFSIVVSQVRQILYSMFDWEDGEFTFQVGQYRTDEIIQLHIPARQAILQGIKAMTNPKHVVHLLGPSWTLFDPSYAGADISDIGLEPTEIRFLSQVDGVRTLKELIGMGPGDAAHNAKLVYGFFILRLITRRETTAKSIKKLQWKTSGGEFASNS